ncbi:alpha/beta fold hydrolase [Pseudonocardia spinosispora]|uniref:alpha/beta fold hydrolase n=1 Tax=Pseudonocardia spinosispora TaxID=103441 RepID=UPI0004110A17|nr:alpha/beta fold hydrolase [Pseudonocardia spinosispora]
MRYFVTPGEDRRLDAATRSTLRGSFVRLSDGVTHYELTGPHGGDVVVLVGGLTVPLFYWDSTVAALHAHGLRTLTYSGYGRGWSDRVQGRYDEALFARQLDELVRELDLPTPHHLVGTSMGALVAMTHALAHPVSTLTLVGPAGLGPRPVPYRLLLGTDLTVGLLARRFGGRLLEHHLGHEVRDPVLGAELAALVRDAYRCEGSRYALFATLRHFPLFDRAELYRRAGELPVPITLIWGARDTVTPIGSLDRVRSLLRPTHCQVVSDCGHMVPFERPTTVADLVAAHAERPQR